MRTGSHEWLPTSEYRGPCCRDLPHVCPRNWGSAGPLAATDARLVGWLKLPTIVQSDLLLRSDGAARPQTLPDGTEGLSHWGR